MSPNLRNLMSHIQNEYGFGLYLDDKSASTYSDHRALLRKQLYKRTKNKTVFDLTQFLNIAPQFVSISHCPVMGGFVIGDQPVGLDLEQFQRLSASVIQRISKLEEQNLFSENQMKSIWAIKESVYKCEASFDSNIPLVNITSVKGLESGNLEVTALKTVSEFKNKNFETLSFICTNDDLILSLSYLLNYTKD